jgi:putative phosphoesterase
MRLAVVADIHGNIRGLKAVLADLKRTSPDVVVNLGDCVSGPLEAAETCDFLMDLGWQTVRGNHDRWLVERTPEKMGRSDQAAFEELTDRNKAWLGALPPTAKVGDDILLCHAAPQDDLTYLLETVQADGAVRAATPSEITQRMGAVKASLLLCGHTHTARAVALPGLMIVNPGSAGLPAYRDDEPVPHAMEMKSPHARYALIDRTSGGFDVTFRLVCYDWDGAAARADAKGRPDWGQWLRTGYGR